MDERPEFTTVQRAWLAAEHGLTLDGPVEWRPGMWFLFGRQSWRVFGVDDDDGAPEVTALRWHSERLTWVEGADFDAWLEDVQMIPCDPPESWIAAGRPGAIDDHRDHEDDDGWWQLVADLDEANQRALRLWSAIEQHRDIIPAPAACDRALWEVLDEGDEGVGDESPICEGKPSGVWWCQVHKGTEDVEPPSRAACSYAYDLDDQPCRWVELLIPTETNQ